MVNSAYNKTVFRSIRNNLSRLIAVIIIILLGISFVGGLGTLSPTIEDSFNDYLKNSNVSDIIVKTTNAMGFSNDDITYFTNHDNVSEVEVFTSIDLKIEEKNARVYFFEKQPNINKIVLEEGRFPQDKNEILVERSSYSINKIQLNDKIVFMNQEYTVSGIVANPLIFEKTGEPNNDLENLNLIIYQYGKSNLPKTDMYLKLKNTKNVNLFSDDYQDIVQKQVDNFLIDNDFIYLTLENNKSYLSINYYIEKVAIITMIFSIFFILVTGLVVLTTMTRMIEEERSTIACYKSLGIDDYKIIFKYVFYAGFACLFAGILGLILGFLILPNVIYPAFEVLYFLPSKSSYLEIWPGLISIISMFIVSSGVTYYVVSKELKDNPATLLLPKAPKVGKTIFLEKISVIWKHLSFKYKSSFRNIFRYKNHLIMTVVAVGGCTALVFAGLGLYCFSINFEIADITGLTEALAPISFVVIVFALLLCCFVIYNLTNMNISERKREIATLSVLGYNDLEVCSYIYREILIMGLLGIIVGIPSGCALLHFVFSLLKFGSIKNVTIIYYILTVVLVIVFILVVDLLLIKKITKIDMMTSLKDRE